MKAGGEGGIPVEDILTLVVGCLGIFVGMSLLLMNQWDYGGRESMHLSAYLQCDELGNKVRFWKMDRRVNDVHGYGRGDSNGSGGSGADLLANERAVGVVKVPNSDKMAVVVASGKALRKVEMELKEKTAKATKTESKRDEVLRYVYCFYIWSLFLTCFSFISHHLFHTDVVTSKIQNRFASYNGVYHQINLSCSSAIPNEISRPFDLFESRLECMSLGHLGVVWDTRIRRNQIMRLAAVEIYNEISAYWFWPFGTPDMEKVLDRSMKRVARLISKDYREPIKVECCGFTIFRCCCRKANPKSATLHDIWDGMEDREQDMMEVRGIANYVDSGDRFFGSSPMEDEAYAAEEKLHRLESGGGYSHQSFRSEERSEYPHPQLGGGYSSNQRVAPTTHRSRNGNSHNVRRIAPESARNATDLPMLTGGGEVYRNSHHVRRIAPESMRHDATEFPLLTGGGVYSSGSRRSAGNPRVRRQEEVEHSISDTRSGSIGTGRQDGLRAFGGKPRVIQEEHSISDTRSGSIRSGQQDGGSRISVSKSQVRGRGSGVLSHDGTRSKIEWDEASESQYFR